MEQKRIEDIKQWIKDYKASNEIKTDLEIKTYILFKKLLKKYEDGKTKK